MLQGYHTHVLVYVVVNTGLFLINLFTRAATAGGGSTGRSSVWGIGLMIHTMVVFGGVFSEGWKQRKADEIYRRGQRSSQKARGGDEG